MLADECLGLSAKEAALTLRVLSENEAGACRAKASPSGNARASTAGPGLGSQPQGGGSSHRPLYLILLQAS